MTARPLVKNLGVELVRGRVKVGTTMRLPERDEVLDVTSNDEDAICPHTAQHATRQAHTAADNVVALLREGR